MLRTLSIVLCVFMVIDNIKTETSSSIPDLLYYCYQNEENLSFEQPFTVESLTELIRKLEMDDRNAFNARILSTSMLHSVIFDGIRRHPIVERGSQSDIIPFRATGEEFYQYKLLVDYLTSGESSLFPSDSLTSHELCFLHMMLSNTVDLTRRGDESISCKPRRKLPLELESLQEDTGFSNCPVKKGVISTKWGSVSAGHLIKAIASALQESDVPFELLEAAVNDTNFTPTNTKVNNVWMGTVAGDLANLILTQTSSDPVFGTRGFWNDTLLPRIYYLESADWQMTEADILGGIDGLIIAHHLQKNTIPGIRVSQLIDMLYSNRSLDGDEIRVTKRSIVLDKLLSGIDLGTQVASTAKLLQKVGVYDVHLSEKQIDEMGAAVSQNFKKLAENITRTYDNVESIHGIQLKSSMEIIIILDGSYESYTALQVVHRIFEAVQASQHSSKLGVINGQSGKWMANVTREQHKLFTDLAQTRQEWPSTLYLGRSLETVIYYYQNNTNCSAKSKPLAKAVVVLSKNPRLTDNDLVRSQRTYNSIKKSNPETSFIFVSSSDKTGFISNFWENDHILNPSEDSHTAIRDITNVLSTIPGTFINAFCKKSDAEDFLTPEVEKHYEIRKEYTDSSIITKFRNSNQGSVSVCAYGASLKKNKICRDLTVNDEISFDSEEVCGSEPCTINFQLIANSSEFLCIEKDCRYPDQVRLEIQCASSGYGIVPMQMLIFCLVSKLLIKL